MFPGGGSVGVDATVATAAMGVNQLSSLRDGRAVVPSPSGSAASLNSEIRPSAAAFAAARASAIAPGARASLTPWRCASNCWWRPTVRGEAG